MEKKDFHRLTNVDELLNGGTESDSPLSQLVQPQTIANVIEVRSTVDPFQIQLAQATMANHLDRATPTTRKWAWILLASPPLIAWFIFAYSLITDPGYEPNAIDLRSNSSKLVDRLIPWVFGIASLVPALFWPYLLLRNSRRNKNQLKRTRASRTT